MKITVGQLRQLIREVSTSIGSERERVDKPINQFVKALNAAKQPLNTNAKEALTTLMQLSRDEKSGQRVQQLLDATTKINAAIDQIIRWLDKMPELTKDPWHNVRRGQG